MESKRQKTKKDKGGLTLELESGLSGRNAKVRQVSTPTITEQIRKAE